MRAFRQLRNNQGIARRFGFGDLATFQTVAAIAVPAVFLSAFSGCTVNRGHTKDTRQATPVSIRYQSSGSATHLAAPSTGFDTGIQTPLVTPRQSEVDPLKQVPVPAPPISKLRVPSGKRALDNWGQFDDPVLRQLQTAALNNAKSAADIMSKLDDDSQLGGSKAQPNMEFGPSAYERTLLLRVAEAYVDTKLHQQRLADYHENLTLQLDAEKQARKRKEEGKAGRLDILQIESAAGVTKSKLAPIREDLRAGMKRLEVLTGGRFDQAMIRSIASQRQLRLPDVEQTIPASILRRRCDVGTAEDQVINAGAEAKVFEATILPMLSLEGELTANLQESDEQSGAGGFGFSVGEDATWNFTNDEQNEQQVQGSLVRESLKDYQSKVFNAANEVELYLTQYHVTLAEIESLEKARENASEATRLAMQQFEADRIRGGHVVSSQSRRVLAGQALAEARARLARISIELFLATGAECDVEETPKTSFYSTSVLK